MSPRSAARLALACLDLTSLNDDDSDASIEALAARADTPHGAPAALCVYPRFVASARRALDARGLQAVRVATVVNFPHGDAAPGAVAQAIGPALAAGANEIDAVLPWRALRNGDAGPAHALVHTCRKACGGALLKIILETGELHTPALIRSACEIALAGGADFLKTSTGKVARNATPEAVAVMLQVIVDQAPTAGLKIAGGVASVAHVQGYFAQVEAARGAAGLTPQRLRFGASALLGALLAELDGSAPGSPIADAY
jgi:deoxyribose-phosphate aldolase